MTLIDPKKCARVVLKVGSAVVAPGGNLDHDAIDRIVSSIASAKAAGCRVVFVSSGAVASGFRAIGLDTPPAAIRDKQAAAAVGQPRLVFEYASRLERRGIVAAQVLLTQDDFDHRGRFLNARHTLETLLDRGVVPIVNENDSVSFDEIRVGDNDRLSALVAGLVSADTLVLMSTAGGLHAGGVDGPVIPVVSDLDAALAHVEPGRSETGTGGFATKLDAARMATGMGVRVVIAPGPTKQEPDPFGAVLTGGAIGTAIEAPTDLKPDSARKFWLMHASQARGQIVVDEGAVRALVDHGASLLPRGVTEVRGTFDIGALVDVMGPNAELVARGLTSYPSYEAAKLAGVASEGIESVLGYRYCDEMIHRDDLAVVRKGAEA